MEYEKFQYCLNIDFDITYAQKTKTVFTTLLFLLSFRLHMDRTSVCKTNFYITNNKRSAHSEMNVSCERKEKIQTEKQKRRCASESRKAKWWCIKMRTCVHTHATKSEEKNAVVIVFCEIQCNVQHGRATTKKNRISIKERN